MATICKDGRTNTTIIWGIFVGLKILQMSSSKYISYYHTLLILSLCIEGKLICSK